MTDLKPCPFCASNHISIRTTHRRDNVFNTQYEVYCLICSAVGGSRTTENKAIEAWNTRAYEKHISSVKLEKKEW